MKAGFLYVAQKSQLPHNKLLFFLVFRFLYQSISIYFGFQQSNIFHFVIPQLKEKLTGWRDR
jgi:hypothetical protein